MKRLINASDNGVLFNPVEGETYLNTNGQQYKCIQLTGQYTAIMRSNGGWTCECHDIRLYDNNTIDWAYSTGGKFAKVAELENEKEVVKEIKEEVNNKLEKPYFNFRDVFYLVEEDKVREEYDKVKNDYSSFKEFCKKNGYAEFDIKKRNFTNEYVVNRFLDENNLEIQTKPIESKTASISKHKTLVKKAYKLEELSPSAQENAQENIFNYGYDGMEIYNESLQEIYDEIINNTFPNSDVHYTYSFSYSQGDGFGIYGSLSFDDIEKLTNESFTDLEKDMINCGTYTENNYDVPINNDRQSTFFNDNMVELDYENDLDYFLDYDPYFEGTQEDLDNAAEHIDEIEKKLQKVLSDFCGDMERTGYDYLYDEEMYLEDLYANGYEFDEDGNIVKI